MEAKPPRWEKASDNQTMPPPQRANVGTGTDMTSIKRKWRLEVITPSSESRWLRVLYFDDDKLYVVRKLFPIERAREWEFRIVPND
jgi:hypothetical protein